MEIVVPLLAFVFSILVLYYVIEAAVHSALSKHQRDLQKHDA